MKYITRGRWSLVLGVCFLGACVGDHNRTERVREVGQAVEEHGANQPWVECANHTHRTGADPLGPVIAHSYGEGPGRPSLDSAQQAFLVHASLRARSGGSPNTIIYEDLELPVESPTDAQVESWVTGAIELAAKRLPATLRVTRSRTTAKEDSAENEIPSFKVWDMAFFHEDVVIEGSACYLVAGVGTVKPATLVCRLEPGSSPILTYGSFTRTLAQAESAAKTATGTANLLESSKRYVIVDGDTSSPAFLARYVVYVSDGTTDQAVVLDGAANVLASGSITRSVTFKGVDLDYLAGGIQTLSAPIDNGNAASVSLDTWPVAPPANETTCALSDKKSLGGFAICGNPASTTSITKNGVNTTLLVPTVSNDFTTRTDTTVSCATCAGGDAPGFPVSGGSNGVVNLLSSWSETPANNQTAHVHWAELQAFYSIGALQKRYQLLGHPDRCENKPAECIHPTMDGQAPFRLQINVHASGGSDSAPIKAGLGNISFGDLGDSSASSAVESVADGTLVAHEYNHYVLSSIEATSANGWSPSTPNVCGLCEISSMCPSLSGARECLHEGLADAFASLFTDREKLLPSFKSPFAAQASCSDPNNYPDNPFDTLEHKFRRNACNSVVYGYWDTAPDCAVPGSTEAHRRGSVIFGALFQFMKRYKDAGYDYVVPGSHMYEAQKRLVSPLDDERSYLDTMLSVVLASKLTKRFSPLAQVAFAEKNVFPTKCYFDCDDQEIAMARLSVAGPITWDSGASAAPEFKAFVPQGGAYEATALFELSDNPAFSAASGGVVTSVSLPKVSAPPNNSPAGFRAFTPNLAAVWAPVRDKALTTTYKRVYYRVTQCQTGSTLCVTTMPFANADVQPFVALATSASAALCSYRPGSSRGNGALLLMGAGLVLGLIRRRGSGKDRATP